MDFLNHIFVVCACLATLLRNIQCQTEEDAKNLRKKLFITDGYDYLIRPIHNQSDPIVTVALPVECGGGKTSPTDCNRNCGTVIHFEFWRSLSPIFVYRYIDEVVIHFNLLSINELDEVTQTLTTTGFLSMHWHDDFLQWSPSSYGGIEIIRCPQDHVWKPDVFLKNSVVDYKSMGASTLMVKIQSTGRVYWHPVQVFQSTCSMAITRFPFDVHTCELKFYAWSYPINEVYMRSANKGLWLDQYESNSEWDIISTGWRVAEKYKEASMVFTLTIKRKALYDVLSIVIPIVMLAILNIFVFVLPSDSGERASYAITVFLTFAVYLTIVSTTLPKNSDSVAIFSVYVVFQTLQSTVITLLALTTIRCSAFSENDPVPKCLILLIRLFTCKPFRQRVANRKKIYDVQEDLRARNGNGTLDAPEENPTDVKDDTHTNMTMYSWKTVINTLDRIFFCLFSILFVTSTIICLAVAITP